MLLQLSGSHVLRETWDRLEDLTRDVDGYVHLMSEQSYFKAFIGMQENKSKAASMTLQLSQLQEKLELALGLETYRVRLLFFLLLLVVLLSNTLLLVLLVFLMYVIAIRGF